jgi:hypothetical protein
MILAAETGNTGYESSTSLSDSEWTVLAEGITMAQAIAHKHSLLAALHPHYGTVIEGADEIRRLLSTTDVALCLDTGHLMVAGADPAAITRLANGRIAHVHLKDVNTALAERVRKREIGYHDAVSQGMYRPLGEGDVDFVEIMSLLDRATLLGWFCHRAGSCNQLAFRCRIASFKCETQHPVSGVSQRNVDLSVNVTNTSAAQFDVITMGRVGVDLYPNESGVPLAQVTQFSPFPRRKSDQT